jgi:hypothetical protein
LLLEQVSIVVLWSTLQKQALIEQQWSALLQEQQSTERPVSKSPQVRGSTERPVSILTQASVVLPRLTQAQWQYLLLM